MQRRVYLRLKENKSSKIKLSKEPIPKPPEEYYETITIIVCDTTRIRLEICSLCLSHWTFNERERERSRDISTFVSFNAAEMVCCLTSSRRSLTFIPNEHFSNVCYYHVTFAFIGWNVISLACKAVSDFRISRATLSNWKFIPSLIVSLFKSAREH